MRSPFFFDYLLIFLYLLTGGKFVGRMIGSFDSGEIEGVA
jgi:hypothetical protein